MKNRRNYVKTLVVLILIIVSLSTTIEAGIPYKTYTEDGYGRYVETQTAYEPVGTITKIGDLTLSGAKDMLIGEDGFLYIADTNNKRVIKATLEGELIQTIGESDLSMPTGIFFRDEKLYVADESKGKIFVYDQTGALVIEYGKPDHPLFGNKSTFKPQKLVVDDRGTMYIISKGNNNGIIQISPSEDGSFLGYFGANDTRTSLLTIFRKSIFTEEQEARMAKSEPVTIANIAIDDRGLIYTVSQGEKQLTLKKMNIAGKNLLFPKVYDQYPAAVVTGSLDNIIVASKNGFIYEYNSEGSLLFVFGARDDGKQRIGLFKTVSAIDVDSANRLFVLDEEKNEIQIFGTTEFADLVHNAVDLYQKGRYTESKAPWHEVLKMNSLFDYANLGIGEAYYKEENYDKALTAYRLAKNYSGFSQAFWEVRNKWMKENLVYIIMGLFFLYVLLKILKRVDRRLHIYNPLRRVKKKVFSVQLIKEMSFITYIMKDPADGYYGIRREEKVSSLAAHAWLAIAFIIYIVGKYSSSYLYKTSMEGRFDLLNDVYFFFGVIFMLVISHYLVTSINDGEGRFKDIYQGFIYALGPYILIKPWLILLSHGLTYNEAFIIQFGNFFINTWTLIMIILMIKYINDYSAIETFKVIIYTLFTMLIGILVLFIVYVLLSQVIEFVQSIVGEVVYKFVS